MPSALFSGACYVLPSRESTPAGQPTATYQQGYPSLATMARAKNMDFGLMTYQDDLALDTAILTAEASIIGSTHDWKWTYLQPSEGTFVYTEPDAIVALAVANGQKVKAHTWIYDGSAQPSWINTFLDANVGNKAAAQAKLQAHIAAVGTHFSGQLNWIDVTNECFNNVDGISGGYRNSRWYKAYGDATYIRDAFVATRAVDSTAKLLLNENLGRYTTADDIANRANVLTFLDTELALGTPIDGVGFQCHMQPDTAAIIDEPSIGAYFDAIAAKVNLVTGLNLEIQVTEVDVDDFDISSAFVAQWDATVARRYQRILNVCFTRPAVKSIINFGVSDRHNGNNTSHPRVDGFMDRGLLLDANGQRKAAWLQFHNFFQRTVSR